MDLLMDIVGKVGEDERPVNDFSVSYEEDGEEEMLDDWNTNYVTCSMDVLIS